MPTTEPAAPGTPALLTSAAHLRAGLTNLTALAPATPSQALPKEDPTRGPRAIGILVAGDARKPLTDQGSGKALRRFC